jgi:hypothetical protein
MDKHTQELGTKLLRALQDTNSLLRGGQPRQNELEAESKSAETENGANPAPRQVSLHAQIYPTPTCRQETEKKWYETFKGWKSLFEIVGICAAIFYAGTNFFQWRDAGKNFKSGQRPWVGIEVPVRHS